MLGVEVDEWLWIVRVDPDLAEDAHVDGAHELLSQDVETVSYSVKSPVSFALFSSGHWDWEW